MWIEPDVAGCDWAEASRVILSHEADTVTASKAVDWEESA